MVKIKLDYQRESMCAIIAAPGECSELHWSLISRFFEERCSSTVVNGKTLTCPWWEFVAFRTSFQYILKVNSLGIDVGRKALELLRESISRENEYNTVSTIGNDEIDENNIASLLNDAGFIRDLFPYQIRNVIKLIRASSGATFSVPGAGKTTEALAFFSLKKRQNERLLVIAPNNAFVAWEDELPACLPGSKSLIRLTGGEREICNSLSLNPDFSIISYYQLPYVRAHLHAFLTRNNVCVFVDESHRMKRGQDGVHGACILGLACLARRKLVLSGTPMPNSSTDLVSQFQFLYPDIETTSKNVISNFQEFFVRTTKSELSLPIVRRVDVNVHMSPLQSQLYFSLASDAARHINGLSADDRLLFRKVSKCVQYMLMACSNPILLAKSQIGEHPLLRDVIAEGISPKLSEACRLARKLVSEGKKVLIWSCFISTIEHLAGMLSDLGAEYIHGGVTTSDDEKSLVSREAVIRRFNNPNSDTYVLVANPAACSEGISLHHICHNAIYVDRNYNAAQYLQSEDRIHRIGVPEDVQTNIITLTTPNSIDISVNRRLEIKVENMAKALNDPCLNISSISLDDIDNANAYGIDGDDVNDIKQLLGSSE